MKRGFVFLLAFFTLIVSGSMVSADFEVGNLSHKLNYTHYSPEDNIKGWINISLNNEPTTSIFEDSFGNSMSLIDLIEKNTGFQKTCTPKNCEPGYSTITGTGETNKVFNLDAGNSEIFGFEFIGSNFNSISDFSIIVTSDVLESDYPQLYIDILNDGVIEWQSHNASGNFRNKIYGCYSSTDVEGQAEITQTKYCEKIKIPAAPNVEIGANIIENTGGNVEFEMTIYNNTYGDYDFCIANGSETGEIGCVPLDFKINEERDFYVCIRTKNSEDGGKYKINYETKGTCGFAGSSNYDFEIFAKPGKYSPVGSFILNNTELKNLGKYGFNIENNITNYIYQKYNDDCSNKCTVPIKFISEKNSQQIEVSDIDILYNTGISTTTDKIYELTETLATIDADFQKLYLDEGNFSVSEDYGDFIFQLNLDDKKIFSEEIFIEETPIIKNLKPRTTASAYPTEFEVSVESPAETNITQYKWNFGNGDTKTTTTNKVTYTYNSTGEYNLKITVTDSSQRSSYKIFKVTVGLPKEIIERLLEKMQTDLNNVKAQINSFSLFYRESLNSVLELETIENTLKDIQKEYTTKANSEEEFNNIMTSLLELEVPESIITTKSADSILFYPEEYNINLDILQEIGGGSYNSSDESKYINAILSWHQENIETKITFKELSARYEYSEELILKVFELEINEKNALKQSPYLILRKLDELKFKENYLENEKSGYIYIDLESIDEVTFSTTEDIGFVDLPLFISPEIRELVLTGEIFDSDKEKRSRWIFFILIIIFLATMGFIVYIILQEWYKNKYEDYLFKNRNNLYNLITYIENAKNKGLKNKEIMERLKKAGWNSEQRAYAIKKHSGKRTGMFEISIGKILNIFKKKNVQKISQRGNIMRGKNFGQAKKFP